MADKDNSDDSAKTSGSKSLNEQNWPGLLAITALNLVIFGVMTATDPTPYSKLSTAWGFLLPVGIGLAMIRVITGLLNEKNKNRLVFWRWQNALPGCEAYTVHVKNDDRYDAAEVMRLFHPDLDDPPTWKEPKKQNAHWLNNIFYPMQDKPAVQQANRNFLFTRDYAAISFVMFIVLSIAGYFTIPSHVTWAFYSLGLFFQYLVVRWAARNYGIETVTNSIAQAVDAAKKREREAAGRVA